mmetsp:Transcript_109165/g.308630  ORF Transcript_109165/g.308630 Transcript_109165/m.308630 type:complete len:121 (+) Transcript_109165:2-364(+)
MVVHCHILQHEDEGMMGFFAIGGAEGTIYPQAETLDPSCYRAAYVASIATTSTATTSTATTSTATTSTATTSTATTSTATGGAGGTTTVTTPAATEVNAAVRARYGAAAIVGLGWAVLRA